MEPSAIQFEEGKECPVQIAGTGGGLSFSPAGDMLFIANVENIREITLVLKFISSVYRNKILLFLISFRAYSKYFIILFDIIIGY